MIGKDVITSIDNIFIALNSQLLQIKYIVVFHVWNLRNYFKII